MSTGRKWLIAVALWALVAGTAVAQAQSGMGHGPMGHGMMGGGPGMMGMGCPMMMDGADLKVEKLKDGVAIRLTSSDPRIVERIQKRAEIMRLVHELEQEGP